MIAGIYPGQGAQHPGMGKFLFDNFQIAKDRFEEASDRIGVDFKKLCFEGTESDLALTENTQPALLLVSVATFDSLQEVAPQKFSFHAGHSIGEYAAAVNSGSLKFADAVEAVRKRGQFMQSAVPVGQGAMAAVMGLDVQQVEQLCEWTTKESGHGPVEPANFNAPGQIVVSGNKKGLDWMASHLSKDIFSDPPKRLKVIPLKVSAPFHCSMMKPAEEQMAGVIQAISFSEAKAPIVQNVSAEPETNPERIAENLVRQISSPVRWIECVQTMKNQGVTHGFELGCGKVLNGLVKKIAPDLEILNINSLDELKEIEKNFAN